METIIILTILLILSVFILLGLVSIISYSLGKQHGESRGQIEELKKNHAEELSNAVGQIMQHNAMTVQAVQQAVMDGAPQEEESKISGFSSS